VLTRSRLLAQSISFFVTITPPLPSVSASVKQGAVVWKTNHGPSGAMLDLCSRNTSYVRPKYRFSVWFVYAFTYWIVFGVRHTTQVLWNAASFHTHLLAYDLFHGLKEQKWKVAHA